MQDRSCPLCESRLWTALFEQRDLLHDAPGVFTVVRCTGCGLVSYNPLPDPHTLGSYYPPDYYSYQPLPRPRESGLRRLVDDLHLGIRRNPALVALFTPLLWYKEAHSYARYLRPIRRGRLLDVGCGDGGFLLKARRMGFECYGLEPGGTQEAIDGVPILESPVEDLRGFDGFFDVVTANHVIEHVLDPVEVLSKIRGLLRPGGRVLIRTPRTDHFVFRRWAKTWYGLDVPRHIYLFDPATLRRLAARCGFVVERIVPEAVPVHYQRTLKATLWRKRFLAPHWTDSILVSFAFLPLGALLNVLDQADGMAAWLCPQVEPPAEATPRPGG